MFQDPRTGDGAVLGHMADQEHAGAGLLAQAHDQAGAFPDLAHAAGGGGHLRTVHGLDGVNHRDVRLDIPDLFFHGVQGVLRQNVEVALHAQPPGAQLDLPRGFLAGNVHHALSVPGQVVAGLQQQGALSDARVAADQDQSALDDAAPQYPVQLADAGTAPQGSILGDILQGHRLRAGTGALVRGNLSAGLLRCGGDNAFFQCVPRPAARAAPDPARRFISARAAGENRSGLRHAVFPSFRKQGGALRLRPG